MELMETDIGESISRESFTSSVVVPSAVVVESDEGRAAKRQKKSGGGGGRSLASSMSAIRDKSPLLRGSTALHILQAAQNAQARRSPAASPAVRAAQAMQHAPELDLGSPEPVATTTTTPSPGTPKSPKLKAFRAPPRSKLEQERMNLPIYAGVGRTGRQGPSRGSDSRTRRTFRAHCSLSLALSSTCVHMCALSPLQPRTRSSRQCSRTTT